MPRHWQRTRRELSVNALAAAVMTCWTMYQPNPSLAGSSNTFRRPQPNCGEPSGSKSGPNYLSFDESMELAMGTWGRSVHPLGPDFYRYQRVKHEHQALASACPKKFQKRIKLSRDLLFRSIA